MCILTGGTAAVMCIAIYWDLCKAYMNIPFNLIMCIGILLLRHPIVRMFLSDPTKEIYHYSDMYLTIVAPFYFVLGLLAVYRTSIQSMQNGKAPFAACMIELVMRIAATVGLSGIIGYTSVCIASPMAWIGACALLIPVYYKMMKTSKTPAKTVNAEG